MILFVDDVARSGVWCEKNSPVLETRKDFEFMLYELRCLTSSVPIIKAAQACKLQAIGCPVKIGVAWKFPSQFLFALLLT